jgi:aspartyl-tRNA(Asn)/glutamyl-tRNA(Gln) amidotransferase subunit A
MDKSAGSAPVSRREFALLCTSAALAAGFRLPAWGRSEGKPTAASNDLTALTLTEASAKLHSRAITSVQLTQAHLARIAIYQPKVNAYITILQDEALAQAAALDAELKAGHSRGPLHGIPIAMKDNIDTAGIRTTAASPMFKDRIPTEDAEIVLRLRNAGVVLLGKLNLHEFAVGCTGDVSYFGPTRNPWALDRVSGGSSAGSGAAVATDLCLAALGTDTGGSIRVPSAWCGIVGLKPTIGLVSIRGIIPCSAPLDHCGPMTRTVEDAALMLNHMAGYDPMDIYSIQRPGFEAGPEDYIQSMHQPVKTLRLGLPQSFYDHIDPEVEPSIKAAIEVLTRLTAGVTSHAPLLSIPPNIGDLGEADAYHADLVRQYGNNYMPPTRNRMITPGTPAATSTAEEAGRAHEHLATIRRTVDKSFTNFDLAIVPTVRYLPPKINASLAQEMAGNTRKRKVYEFFEGSSPCGNTSPFDGYGIPAISVPCGFSKDGMPIGLMIAGPHYAEGKVLALAYAFQQATDWHLRRPPVSPNSPVPPIVEAPEPPTPAEKTPTPPTGD